MCRSGGRAAQGASIVTLESDGGSSDRRRGVSEGRDLEAPGVRRSTLNELSIHRQRCLPAKSLDAQVGEHVVTALQLGEPTPRAVPRRGRADQRARPSMKAVFMHRPLCESMPVRLQTRPITSSRQSGIATPNVRASSPLSSREFAGRVAGVGYADDGIPSTASARTLSRAANAGDSAAVAITRRA